MSLFKFFRKETTEVKAQPHGPTAKMPSGPRVLASAAVAAPVAPPVVTPHAAAVTTEPDPLDIERIRLELAEIARIVGNEEEGGKETGINLDDLTMVDLKLVDIVTIVPQAFREDARFESKNDTYLSVLVPDLFDQLARGKVETTVGRLVADIPEDYLTPFVDEHADDKVSLPLPMVVTAVQPGELRKRTAAKEKDRGEKMLPNLFGPSSAKTEAAPAVAPVVELPAPVAPVVEAPTPEPVAAAVEPEPMVVEIKPEEIAPAVPEEAPVVAETVQPVVEESVEPVVEPTRETTSEPIVAESTGVLAEEPVAAEPAIIHEVQAAPLAEPEPIAAAGEPAIPEPEPVSVDSVEAEPELTVVDADEEVPVVAEVDSGRGGVLIAGIDLNRATADELHARLDGVGKKLADRIVADRDANGPFSSIYDLARVSGLRRKTFEHVTGLPLKPMQYKYREMLRQLLGPDNVTPDVRQVAARFKEIPDYVGCLIALEDGFVLAGSWDHPAADPLGAFAPQMFKKIGRYVKQLKLGDLKCIVFFLEAQPVALVKSGRILFAALLASEKLARKQVELVQALTEELGRRLGG